MCGVFFCIFTVVGGGKGIPNLTFGLKIYPFSHRLSIFVDVLSSVTCKPVKAARGHSGQGLCDLPPWWCVNVWRTFLSAPFPPPLGSVLFLPS